MPRPKRCRKICGYPDYWSFIPEEEDPSDTIFITLDEFETIRQIDLKKLTQDQCASEMEVSRATVTGIYESARYKIADALMHGKRLRIAGGTYRMEPVPIAENLKEKGEDVMRVAVTYEQEMVGQHFGRTEKFKIYDITGGRIVSSQVIDTNGNGHGALAGFLKAADVQTLICGGIGMGARNALNEEGIELFPGVTGKADDVIKDYIDGKLDFDPNTACDHHDHGHGEGHDCGHGGGCGTH
ncbi:MAG: DUF134 domain-containing protein [Lachnospiraceae bacterium]|nr:DUF134 domain-containing protein [Lachnospiraceae bacterium]